MGLVDAILMSLSAGAKQQESMKAQLTQGVDYMCQKKMRIITMCG